MTHGPGIDGRVRFTVVPLRVLGLLLGFLLSPVTLRALWRAAARESRGGRWGAPV